MLFLHAPTIDLQMEITLNGCRVYKETGRAEMTTASLRRESLVRRRRICSVEQSIFVEADGGQASGVAAAAAVAAKIHSIIPVRMIAT